MIWTTSPQTDPRWGTAFRSNLVHDTITSTLSAGPVGFGDLINGTNVTLLHRAIRVDGTILKPASTALRVDRFYRGGEVGGAEIWAAPSGPAGGATDDRANALAPLGEPSADDGLWWWSVIAGNVEGNVPNGQPLRVEELWPMPNSAVEMLALVLETTLESSSTVTRGPPALRNGSTAAENGFVSWTGGTPLDVGTVGASAASGLHTHNFTLYSAAPVLSTGWVLVGDVSKFVPCSPQRFLAPATNLARGGAPQDNDLHPTRDFALEFVVLGSVDEVVPVTVIAPAPAGQHTLDGKVLVYDVVVGTTGSTAVACKEGQCRESSLWN